MLGDRDHFVDISRMDVAIGLASIMQTLIELVLTVEIGMLLDLRCFK